MNWPWKNRSKRKSKTKDKRWDDDWDIIGPEDTPWWEAMLDSLNDAGGDD